MLTYIRHNHDVAPIYEMQRQNKFEGLFRQENKVLALLCPCASLLCRNYYNLKKKKEK